MSFDQGLAERIRDLFKHRQEVTEKKMFGGLAFMQDGHMFVGIVGDKLMARVGPSLYEELLSKPHVSVMDFTGKPMKGYIYVSPAGYESDEDLEKWVAYCAKFVLSLPPKQELHR